MKPGKSTSLLETRQTKKGKPNEPIRRIAGAASPGAHRPPVECRGSGAGPHQAPCVEVQLRDRQYRTEHWERPRAHAPSRARSTPAKCWRTSTSIGTHKTEVNPGQRQSSDRLHPAVPAHPRNCSSWQAQPKRPSPIAQTGDICPRKPLLRRRSRSLTRSAKYPCRGNVARSCSGQQPQGLSPPSRSARGTQQPASAFWTWQARLGRAHRAGRAQPTWGPTLPNFVSNCTASSRARIALQNRPLFKPTPRRWGAPAQCRAGRSDARLLTPTGSCSSPVHLSGWETDCGVRCRWSWRREAADEGESDGRGDRKYFAKRECPEAYDRW